jgi:NAD(P)-dependent dehydrogenase (short-subunit alcohol dehydrogenase family)
MHFNQQVAFITGGSSGIGAATAAAFAREGARVVILGTDSERVDEQVQAIQSSGGEAMPIVADVSDAAAMKNAVDAVIARWGRIDVVFANAGINGVWAPIEDIQPDEWDETINVNLRGTYLTIKYAVPHLKRGGGGSILITSSVNGTRTFSNTGATAYSATKAAQVAIAKMLALELAPFQIRVNVICPGAIETNIDQSTQERNREQVKIPVEYPEGNIPLTGGAPGHAEQVAELALFLASPAASHIAGTEIWIDGAGSLLQG